MILVIDNLDSFTYNLVDILRRGSHDVKVIRQDDPILLQIHSFPIRGIMISPGPGRPEDAGFCMDVVRSHLGKLPILGVCLGHQMLGMLCGMRLSHAGLPTHGKTSPIVHGGQGLFLGMKNPFTAMRYHSLMLEEEKGQDPGIEITATTVAGDIMAIHHKFLIFDAVQFHPESILTEDGERLLTNWMNTL